MSQYIRYILERAGEPLPKQVVVLKHQKDWANRQIVDEFKAVFDGVNVEVLQDVPSEAYDVLVMPYHGYFASAVPGGVDLYRRLYKVEEAKVMLYGLDFRSILIMTTKELLPHYNRCRKTLSIIRTLRRLHLYGATQKLLARSTK